MITLCPTWFRPGSDASGQEQAPPDFLAAVGDPQTTRHVTSFDLDQRAIDGSRVKGGCQFHIRILGVPNDRIAVRLRRDHAKFLEANLTLLAEQTRMAMMPTDLSKERRATFYQRAVLLEHIEDAVRGALLRGDEPTVNLVRKPQVAQPRAKRISVVPESDIRSRAGGGGTFRRRDPGVQEATRTAVPWT
jgi:hypothetical protein